MHPNNQIMDRVISQAGRIFPDTPEDRYIPQAAITHALPFVTFVEPVRSFGALADPVTWSGLGPELQAYCARLGAKLDAIQQAVPVRPDRYPLVGFELLGIGPQGESFPLVLKQFESSDRKLLVKFLLAVVGVETARFLLDIVRYQQLKNFEHTRFTLNLDREMLRSPLMTRFVQRYGDLLRQPNFLVELNEDLLPEDVAAVKELVEREEWRVVLDDLNDWNQEVRCAFETLAVWAKVSHKKFQGLAGRLDDLERYVLPGKPLVVEGVETEEHFRLLVGRWKKGELYIQGHGVDPGSPWDKWLLPLREFSKEKRGGGQIVVSGRLYAMTMQILQTRLPEEVLGTMRCDYREEWARCEIGQGENALRLLMPTRDGHEGGIPFEAHRRDLLISDRLEKKFDQARQLTLERLPLALQAWLHGGRLSRHSLERSERQEVYLEDIYIASASREGEVESLDARLVLLNWLQEPNRPYCAVLGDYGIGKTFLCREFVREVHRLREQGQGSLPAPLYLDLRDYHCKEGTLPKLEGMLEDLLKRADMGDLAVEGVLAMVRAGHLCVIYDGFDEKSASMSAQDGNFLLKEMRRTVPAGGSGKVLIASRTQYFLDHKDEAVRIGGGVRQGTTRDGFQGADFRIIYLQPFDAGRIRAYLENVFPGQGEGILATFQGIHDLMELSTRPFLLQLIAGSLESIQQRVRPGIKVTAGEIYQGVMDAWLARDREKTGMLHPTILPAMESMARFLWSRAGRACSHKRLFQWQMAKAKTLFGADAEVSADMHERLNTLLRTASFLNRDGEGNYRFAHTSFLEFFLARVLGRELAEGRGETLDLPLLSTEAMRFLLDLLSPGEGVRAAATLVRVLEGEYQRFISENALHLALLWQREQPRTAPRPRAWKLAGGELAGVQLAGCHLQNVSFDGANMAGADLTGARITGSLRWADWRRVRAEGSDLTGCDLTGCDLTAANLAGARLVNSRLDDATLSSTFLQRADLRGASLAGAQLSRTRLAWSRLDPDALTGMSADFFSNMTLPPAQSLSQFQAVLQSGHFSGIQAAAFSPDGATLLSGSDDKTLKLWDARTGECLLTCKGHQSYVLSVAFSPDGATLLSGSNDKTLKLWDARTGECLRTCQGHQASVRSVAFSPDGATLLSGSHDDTLKLWDARTGECLRTCQGHQDVVLSVAFSPDGARLLSGSDDKTLKLWDVRTGECLFTCQGHQAFVSSVAFSPDGATLLSGSEDNTLKLWDARTGKCLLTCQDQDSVFSVAFSPDGATLLSGSNDMTLKLWDARTGECLLTCQGDQDFVTSVAFSPDGATLLSGSDDNTLKLWDARTGQCLLICQGHQAYVNSVACNPDGTTLLSGRDDNTLKLWDAHTGECLLTCYGHQEPVFSVAFSPDGATLLSGSSDFTLKFWDVRTGECLLTCDEHQEVVFSVAFSPDGAMLLSGSDDKTLKLWDARTGECLLTCQGHQGVVTSVAFSPDGATLLSGGADNTLKLWDARTGECLLTCHGHQSFVSSVAFSPDGATLLSGSWDDTLKLWDARTGECLLTCQGHQDSVRSVAFSPDVATLLSGSLDKTIKLWNARTGECLFTCQGHQSHISIVAFSPDGSVIVSAGETLRFWDARTGREKVSLWGWEDGGWVGMAPDGRVLACNPPGLARLGFVHQGCVYPGAEFAGCFPDALP
ncbi:MAG: pentapeptide repeat-containing protein [Magnetococcales bacterium]|nr:pentapeptide repeat-containing protein [Magnetococcales bacterium]